ncbi:hypothetical protein Tco_1532106 [Tanacetum coccineum]
MKVLMWLRLVIWENFRYYSNSRLRRLKIHLGVMLVWALGFRSLNLCEYVPPKGRFGLGGIGRCSVLNSGRVLTSIRIAANWGELLDVMIMMSNLIPFQMEFALLSKVCEHIHEELQNCLSGKVYWRSAQVSSRGTPDKFFPRGGGRKNELSVEVKHEGRINDLAGQHNGIDVDFVSSAGFHSEEGVDMKVILVNIDMKDSEKMKEKMDNSFVKTLKMVRANYDVGKQKFRIKAFGWAKLWVITWMGASRISLRSLNPKENLGLIDEFYVFERSRPRPKGQNDWVGIDLMIVVVYAPQEAKEKRMLWDYLAHVSNQWVGHRPILLRDVWYVYGPMLFRSLSLLAVKLMVLDQVGLGFLERGSFNKKMHPKLHGLQSDEVWASGENTRFWLGQLEKRGDVELKEGVLTLWEIFLDDYSVLAKIVTSRTLRVIGVSFFSVALIWEGV